MRGPLILLAVLVAGLVPVAAAPPGGAIAPVECSAPFTVDETLPNGSRWTMCWETRRTEGVVLYNVIYTTPQGDRFRVLGQANLGQLHVPYDDNGVRFHDESDYGLGDGNLNDLQPEDCPDGERLDNDGKHVLCATVGPRGYAVKAYGEVIQGDQLTLHSVSHVGAYNYVVAWTFADDGTITPAVGATGTLQRYSADDDVHGWDVGPNGFGVSHFHNYYWRLDFDLGGRADDVLEQIQFTPDATREQWAIDVDPVTAEQKLRVQPGRQRVWRVRDGAIDNADGHPISYELDPNTDFIFRGPEYEPFSHHEIYATVRRDCERTASHNVGGCNENVSEFVNSQSLVGRDLVVWYGVSFHHLPRDEDEDLMPNHWTEFNLVPRDLTATTPLD